MQRLIRLFALTFSIFAGNQAQAGIPVIDAANLLNSAQQVIAWGQQYGQMVDQIRQLEAQVTQARATFNSLNGVRGMAGLVNDATLRTYLPPDWNQTLSLMSSPGAYTGLSGSISSIKSAARIVGLADTGLGAGTDAGKAFVGAQNQAAVNRGVGEAGYAAASNRIAAIQALLDKVNDAPDQKDILDLQARIQAEQVMVQNESVKLAVLAQLQQAQRDLASQQAREISIKATKTPAGPARF